MHHDIEVVISVDWTRNNMASKLKSLAEDTL